MKILFVSNMPDNKETGLYWSVTNQIISLSKYDNVIWLNICNVTNEYWESTGVYHIGNSLKNLPSYFGMPDLVVFEGFYANIIHIFKEIKHKDIPYIIIPRSSLTKEAQKKSKLKKSIANALIYKKFAKGALAIHYLTNDEKKFSGVEWNANSFVIPNGVVNISDKQWHPKSKTNLNKRTGVFIGRISVFHKGLDLLAEAINFTQEELRQANCTIEVYGSPDTPNDIKIMKSLIDKYGISDILLVKNRGLYNQEKEEKLLSADFFVLTSRLEGHPMGLIEALSYGLPVLATTGCNMSKEIESHDCGWISETTKNGIVSSLKLMLTADNERLINISKNAVKLASQYQWDAIAKETHCKYYNLLNNNI